MRILVDESLPRQLKKMLAGHDVVMVQEMGWGGLKNGPLLRLAEPRFDIYLFSFSRFLFARLPKNARHEFLVIQNLHVLAGWR